MTRSFRILTALTVLVVTLATPALAAPLTYPPLVVQEYPRTEPPTVTAKSWILYDEATDTVLGSLLPDERRPMASVTKIMTGLLALERSDPKEMVTISNRAAETGEREIDLVAGERLPMGALFKSMMVYSANDSATAIAEHIAGSVGAFVDLMNERAAELGLTNTSFANPHGLDAPGHYSSARDLLTLARVAMATPGFADVVRSKAVVIPPAPDGAPRSGTSTDLMLDWYPGAIGIKTGFTSRALLTYVGAAERDGRRLYVVVLGSEGERAHFLDSIKLFDYGFAQLGYFADVALGADYRSVKRQHQPDPLVSLSEVETFVHLANVGLTLERPRPMVIAHDTEPTPVVETRRGVAAPPDSVLSALVFWITSLGGR